MTALPSSRTWVAGEIVSASQMNTTIRDVENFLMAVPILELTETSTQSIPNNALTAMTFTTEVVDSSGMHSTVSNTSRATAVYPGWYATGGASSSAANATGRRGTGFAVNGTDLAASSILNQSTAANVQSTTARHKLLYLNVGDYAEIEAYQNSGGSLNTTVASAVDQPSFTLIWTSS